MIRPNVNISVEKYYAINEIAQLRQFVTDNLTFLTNQKLSVINNKVTQLKRRR